LTAGWPGKTDTSQNRPILMENEDILYLKLKWPEDQDKMAIANFR
jgi:hypothetical protein